MHWVTKWCQAGDIVNRERESLWFLNHHGAINKYLFDKHKAYWNRMFASLTQSVLWKCSSENNGEFKICIGGTIKHGQCQLCYIFTCLGHYSDAGLTQHKDRSICSLNGISAFVLSGIRLLVSSHFSARS